MKTIQFGIDLGTTNSAIARFDGEEMRIFKNKEQMETTPSVVRVDASGRVLTGKKAYDSRIAAAGNVALEFKRTMGQSDRLSFKGVERPWSAEELSAEVLKSLLEDARRLTGEEVRRAVITVPAAFGQLQCEATARAAKLAGLIEAPLLQEPIAAAIAYGLQPDSHDKRWLVYDLGGGTFDLALVSTRDGMLSVLAHAGDNQCGGKDIDWLIVEKLLLPRLTGRFRLPPIHVPEARRLKQALFRAAEEAKIELSSAESTSATVLEAGEDLDGEEIAFEIEISRAEFEALVRPFIDRTVTLCREMLKEAQFGKESLAGVLLVGGPTQMPLLREVLGEELGVPLNFSIDPLTVVARGAAIYASGLAPKDAEAPEPASAGAYFLRLAYEPATMDATCPVIGAIEPPLNSPSGPCLPKPVSDSEGESQPVGTQGESQASGLSIQIEAENGIWSSGWLALEGFAFEIDVPVAPRQTTGFRVALRDQAGNQLPVTPNEFAIRHGLAFDRPPLPHTIGIEVFFPELNRTAVDKLFERSTPLPATRTVNYKARHALSPSDLGKKLVIKLWEGEYLDPEANTWLGALTIRAEEISRPIAEGTTVEMHVYIDASRQMEVNAYVPALDQHFSERVFVPQENEESFIQKARTLQATLDELFDFIHELLPLTDRAGKAASRTELVALRAEMEALGSEREAAELDPDLAKQLIARVKRIRGEVMRIDREVRVDARFALIVRELNEVRSAAESMVQRHGTTGEQQEFAVLDTDAGEAVALQDEAAAKRVTDAFDKLWWTVISRQGWYWRDRFSLMKRPGTAFVDRTLATEALARGESLFNQGDGLQLRPIVERLWDLRPRRGAVNLRNRSGDAGLRK